MYFRQLFVLFATCAAFRSHDTEDSKSEAVPAQYVVPQSHLVDLTRLFIGKTWSVNNVDYRCCKSDADGLGVVKAEDDDSMINSCSSLVGSGFKSFIHFKPVKCVVAYAALPSFLASRVNQQPQKASTVGMLIDLSDILMQGKGEVTLPNGRQIRCCTAKGATSSVLLDPSKSQNALDGTGLDFVHSIGRFNNKKCRGLLGSSYHSWDKWTGNRCFVMSQKIPSDIVQFLKWNEPVEQVPEKPLEPEPPAPAPPAPAPTAPEPTAPEPEAEQPQPVGSWQLSVRVVSATTQKTISGVQVRLLKEDKSVLATSSSNDVGLASFEVPSSELRVFIDMKAEGYASTSRLYKWKHPDGLRSDCYGKEKCITQMALNPNFAS